MDVPGRPGRSFATLGTWRDERSPVRALLRRAPGCDPYSSALYPCGTTDAWTFRPSGCRHHSYGPAHTYREAACRSRLGSGGRFHYQPGARPVLPIAETVGLSKERLSRPFALAGLILNPTTITATLNGISAQSQATAVPLPPRVVSLRPPVLHVPVIQRGWKGENRMRRSLEWQLVPRTFAVVGMWSLGFEAICSIRIR